MNYPDIQKIRESCLNIKDSQFELFINKMNDIEYDYFINLLQYALFKLIQSVDELDKLERDVL